MSFVIVFLSVILAWFFIEITLFISDQNDNHKNNSIKISYKKFIWILRILAIALLFFICIYMYNFNNITFQQAIKYCLELIR